jgi:hypothetical protein
MFSVGGFIGAAVAGVLIPVVGPVLNVALVTGISLAGLAVMLPRLLPGHVDRANPGTSLALPTRAVALIGALTFVTFMTEGAMIDWSAVWLGDELGAGPGLSAAGYAAFAGGMAAGRFAGDGIRSMASAVTLVRWGGLAASVAIVAGAGTGSVPVIVVGLAVAGLGVANIVPLLFSAAGNTPGQPASTAVAAVATTGYFGLLAGPPVIGVLAEATSLSTTFLMLGSGILVVALAAEAARAADSGRSDN